MAKQTISFQVPTSDQQQATELQTALTTLMGYNGAAGILNLYDDLLGSKMFTQQVTTIATGTTAPAPVMQARIDVVVDVVSDQQAAQVKKAIEHILSFNGALGAINLYHKLSSDFTVRMAVKAIASKFRRRGQ